VQQEQFFPMELTVEIDVTCPHCGEAFPLQIDTSQGEQSLIEDCTVCCQPIALTIHCRPGEVLSVSEAPG
jgi:phage terminase large subunit GpA-like protein